MRRLALCPPSRALLARERGGAPESGAQAPLRGAAVEPYVEGAGRERARPASGGQPGGVESVAAGDEHIRLVAADGVRPGEVEHTGGIVPREFPDRGGQVRHVHRAADVVGEQGPVVRAGDQGVRRALVRANRPCPLIGGVRTTAACGPGNRTAVSAAALAAPQG